ncbi:MAG: M28 family peptidase [Pseudomonadota bacterium]
MYRRLILATSLLVSGSILAQDSVDRSAAAHRQFVSAFVLLESSSELATSQARSTKRERRTAAIFLKQALLDAGLTPQSQRYAHRNAVAILDLLLPPMRGENVYLDLPATEKEAATVVVGAHYDTVADSPGADDNASGVSAVMQIAQRLAAMERRSLRFVFVFFDQEEDDISAGSLAFLRFLNERGDRIHSMHNLDMLGWDGDGDRHVEIDASNVALTVHYQAAAIAHGLGVTSVKYNSSDHIPFRDSGLDAVCIGEEVVTGDRSPHYHSRTDTADTLDYAFLARVTLMVGDVMATLAVGE